MIIQLSIIYNTHEVISKWIHQELKRFTYYELRNEVLTDGD